jgi:hypothetical protein
MLRHLAVDVTNTERRRTLEKSDGIVRHSNIDRLPRRRRPVGVAIDNRDAR